MFLHPDPYKPFIPNATKLIEVTLPPSRFLLNTLLEGAINFCHGGINGQLLKILDTIFKLNLVCQTSDKEIQHGNYF